MKSTACARGVARERSKKALLHKKKFAWAAGRLRADAENRRHSRIRPIVSLPPRPVYMRTWRSQAYDRMISLTRRMQ
jgi:hypothetical protein